MSYFGNSNKGEKILRGAYNYYTGDNLYAEENFELYRRGKLNQYYFEGELVSRVMTGELLKVNVSYTVDKDYTPISVYIIKSLGEQVSKEIFLFDHSTSELKYRFECGDDKKSEIINTSPKFYVTTPMSHCSMIFLWSKKFDSVGKNYYSVFTSNNNWKYEHPIENRNLVVERVSATSEQIKIDGSNVTSIQYKVGIKEVGDDKSREELRGQELNVWLSQYHTVPYIIKDSENSLITIKYLNNLAE